MNELKERVQVMQALRGQSVAPIVKLTSMPFNAKMGPKQRPRFEIIEWRSFGPSPAAMEGPKAPQIGKPVKEPTLAEELNDALPF